MNPVPPVPPAPTQDDPQGVPAKRGLVRRMYDWMLAWAQTRYASRALFGFSFAESSFFPIPPDVLLATLCFGRPRYWAGFAFWCALGSVLGGIAGYYIGFLLYESIGAPIVNFYNGQAVMDRIGQTYDESGFVGILVAAITPIPYKVFTIASGVFKFNLLEFVVASIVGRSFRFFAVAGLIRLFGEKIRPFIEQRFELMMMIFGVLLVGGFIALKFLR